MKKITFQTLCLFFLFTFQVFFPSILQANSHLPEEPNYYQVLGINPKNYIDEEGLSKGDFQKDLKRVYRKIAMKYHPDRNPGNLEAERKFKEAATAYETLHDPAKKEVYDNKYPQYTFTEPNYYKVFGMNPKNYIDKEGLSKGKFQESLKKVFRKLIMKYHPDRDLENLEMEQKFEEVITAYEILKDPTKKEAYDNKYPEYIFGEDSK